MIDRLQNFGVPVDAIRRFNGNRPRSRPMSGIAREPFILTLTDAAAMAVALEPLYWRATHVGSVRRF